jgi:hypothetical protein
MPVIDNIPFLPVPCPFAHQEDVDPTIFLGADDAIKAAVDDHFLTYKTGEGVDRFVFPVDAAEDIHIASQEANPRPGSVDNGVLFGVDAAAELVALAVGDFEFVSKTKSMFEAVLGFSWGSHVSRGDDLVIPDYDGTYRTTKAGAPSGYLFGNPEIVFIFGNSLCFHRNLSSF